MKKKKRWLILLLMMIGLIVYWLLNRPVKGTIKMTKVDNMDITKTAMATYDGAYLKFEYVDKYSVRLISQQDENNLENIQLVGKSGELGGLVITLRKNPVGVLEDVSGVKLRQIRKEEYEQEKINWNGVEGLLFKKVEPFELTAFFLHEGKSLTMAMTANSSENEEYREEFMKMLGTMVVK